MLLLMRRVGETIRINDTITIQIIKIGAEGVTFKVDDLSADVKNGPPVHDKPKNSKKEKNQT